MLSGNVFATTHFQKSEFIYESLLDWAECFSAPSCEYMHCPVIINILIKIDNLKLT